MILQLSKWDIYPDSPLLGHCMESDFSFVQGMFGSFWNKYVMNSKWSQGISNQIKADKKLVDLVRLVAETFDFVRDTETFLDKCRSLDNAIISLLKQTTEFCFFVRHYTKHGLAGN